ncbi:hypothetical protein K505DRAFT_336617 [Melanomma pulvis-pyrius CBS 109.77]|uniref:Uncharacterized protein n=1 Tax=Melanomma pulvis-pyrius CBS 109.77 TaxID=1314802 RepID=A0A6A6XEF0_9PLEO|nr:hypothetical protein K505DRAFT_336617 [Melanomma pulvis-pyrius CBS 109.77]
MRSFRTMALLALPMLRSVLCEEPASPTQDLNANHVYSNANEAFQDLLNALPEESLHVALNSLTKFKDGVFESDRHGVEHVHHDNPPLATKLIVAAVQDLKKRQLPAPTNGTISSTPPPQTSQQPSSGPPPSQVQSSAPPPSSSKSAVIVPVEVTTTDSAGQPTVISSAILSEATAFIPIDVTRTNEQGSTVVSQETKPAVIFTATDSAGSAFVTTSAVNFAPTAGEVLTTINAQGSTFLTTYTPGGGRVSSIVLVTTQGPDGKPMVITSYTYVDPAAATETNSEASTTGTNTARPGLQTNAARKNGAFEMAVVGGAVGGAFALFV